LTVNVGRFEGGDKRNIVPGKAECEFDLRYEKPEDGAWVIDEIKKIVEHDYSGKGTRSEFSWTLHRPPKLPTPEFESLLKAYQKVAESIGRPLRPTETGGGTDGSLMQAVGLPTLDSLGPDGAGAHTDREEMDAESLIWKSKLAALFLYSYLH
jgi:glutamate carboxypeptidase